MIEEKIFSVAEEIANSVCDCAVIHISGVKEIEYPTELNAIVIVMDNGSKFLLTVSEYFDEQ